MKITRESISDVVIPILEAGANKAIKFFDEKTRIKATRVRKGRIVEIRMSIGRPNYAERRMIRNALKKDKRFLKNRTLVVFYS